MKENFSSVEVNGKTYLFDELTELNEEVDDPTFFIGGWLGAKDFDPEFNPNGIYNGLIIAPKTEVNESLSDNVKRFMLYHECGHCEPGGLPVLKAGEKPYISTETKYELIADKYAVDNLGARSCYDALIEIYTAVSDNIKRFMRSKGVTEEKINLALSVFSTDMSLRLEAIKSYI